MPLTSSNVLKCNDVALGGSRHLGATGAPRAASPSTPEIEPRGRIVEQNDSGAIVEVTCSCGKVFHLHCTYAA